MTGGFPHSDISGSKVIWHLPETYRSHITSFIASWSQGIHHTPFVPIGNAIHRCIDSECRPQIHTAGCCASRDAFENLVKHVCVCVSGTKRPLRRETNFPTRYLLPCLNACEFRQGNLPTGRRFHGRTFSEQVLSTCPWICDYQRSRTPLNFGWKKPRSRGK